MEKLKVHYEGNLRNRLIHLRSGSEIKTDAPVDNNGKGEYFSPTDLLAVSLGSCMLTVVGIAAKKNGFSIQEAFIEVGKHMHANPRKVQEIELAIHFKGQKYNEKQKMLIEKTALNCPVALSLSENLKQTVQFIYD